MSEQVEARIVVTHRPDRTAHVVSFDPRSGRQGPPVVCPSSEVDKTVLHMKAAFERGGSRVTVVERGAR